jgi:hypothetical protein
VICTTAVTEPSLSTEKRIFSPACDTGCETFEQKKPPHA